LIEHNGRRVLYGNDTGIFPEETWEYLAGVPLDVVSLDCTFCGRKDGNNHMGLPDALEVRERLGELKCLKPDTRIILHHFSHNGGACYDEMVELARPHGMEVSFDGGVWEV
jgi:phosphoribosyl 1,2-cyclic phosphate phosphodiesterase